MNLGRYAALAMLLIGGACAALPFAKSPESLPEAPLPAETPAVKLELPNIAVESSQPATSPTPVLDVTPASWHQPKPIVLPADASLPMLPQKPKFSDAASRIREPSFDSPAQPPLPPRVQARRKHRIADGDTLALIALRYLNDQSRGEEIAALNRDAIHNPSLLPVGREIVIPAE